MAGQRGCQLKIARQQQSQQQIGKIHNEENRNMDGAKRGFLAKKMLFKFNEKYNSFDFFNCTYINYV